VTALNDGVLDASFDWLTHIDPAEPPALHAVSFRAVPPRITVNAFLLHLGERLVLVDGGCGGGMGPALGRLASREWAQVGRFLGPSIRGFYARHPVDAIVGYWQQAGLEDVHVRRMSLGGGVIMSATKRTDG